jgi:6-phosphogluconolactonase
MTKSITRTISKSQSGFESLRTFVIAAFAMLWVGAIDSVSSVAVGQGAASTESRSKESSSAAQTFWIGGYGPGIYASRLNPDGSMVEPKLVAKQTRASFFVLHPKLDVLYAVAESANNDPGIKDAGIKDPGRAASLVAYAFDRAAYERGELADLKLINVERVQGDGPCHVTLDSQGRFAVVANYGSGSVSLFPIRADGGLYEESSTLQHQGSGPNQARQEKPHAHCSMVDPTDRWVLVSDLGADKVFVYQLDSQSKRLVPSPNPSLDLAPGSGPRHLSFHPNGKNVYVINELNMTLTSAAWDAQVGKLTEIQTVRTVGESSLQGSWSTAEVLVHPSGRFVYGSNRGHDTIALFAVGPKDGAAVRVENFSTLGKTPRNFRIDSTGVYLLAENQDSDTIHSFRIDSATGFLKPTGHSISAQKPACIKFMLPLSSKP